MNGFMDKLQSILIPVSEKVNRSKILKGINGGFSAMLPVIMAGAIFTLLANLNIGPYQTLITNLGLKPLFLIPVDYTTNMISIYAVFLIAKAYGQAIGMEHENAISTGVIALMFFLILAPLGADGTTESGEAFHLANVVNMTYLGSSGLFTAMIVGLIVPGIVNFLVKHNVTIKMPESVPPMISRSFTAMVPAIVVCFIAIVIRQLCTLTPYGSATMLIYGLLRAPLTAMAASPFTFILLLIICNIMWFFGIHGGMVATSIMSVLYTQVSTEQLSLYAAGEPLKHIIISTAWGTMGNIGGSGCAIGLCICLAIFSKSQRYKALRKVSTIAGLCGISEPMVFGVPIVLNPVLLVPLIVVPIVTFLLGYVAMALGIMPYLNGVTASLGTPMILYGFLTWGTWKGAVFQAFLILVSTVLWFPFFKVIDQQALKEEQQTKAHEAK